MKYKGAVLLLLWIWTALCCTAWHEELCVSTSCLSCPVPFSFWWGGVGVFLKERRAWWVGREKVEGGHWNPATQTSLNGSDRPGPGEERWKLTSTSTHSLCARLEINLSRTWYLFKPQWVSIDTREWSKGEYVLCHQTVGLYLMVTFHIDQEQISSALRSWQSAFFLLKVFFSLLACLLCTCHHLPFPDASLCVLFICWSDQDLNTWYLLMKLLWQWEGRGSSLKLIVFLGSLYASWLDVQTWFTFERLSWARKSALVPEWKHTFITTWISHGLCKHVIWVRSGHWKICSAAVQEVTVRETWGTSQSHVNCVSLENWFRNPDLCISAMCFVWR